MPRDFSGGARDGLIEGGWLRRLAEAGPPRGLGESMREMSRKPELALLLPRPCCWPDVVLRPPEPMADMSSSTLLPSAGRRYALSPPLLMPREGGFEACALGDLKREVRVAEAVGVPLLKSRAESRSEEMSSLAPVLRCGEVCWSS